MRIPTKIWLVSNGTHVTVIIKWAAVTIMKMPFSPGLDNLKVSVYDHLDHST